MTSYLIFDKTSNAANFNATIFGASGARISQPSGATRQALEVVNLGTSNALRVRSGAQHNAIVVGPSGNVGVGTATPVTPLHIHAQATYVSGGNVGIGTTAPIANLHVQGDTQLTGILSAGELRPNGLIAWLPFAGHLFDLSGSNIIGAPTIGSASATPSAATATTTAVHYNPNGREGTSLVGVNPPGGAAATYVTYPIITAAAALPSPTAPTGFAVTAWVRPYATATTGNRQFFFGTDGGYGSAATLAGASILAIGLEPTTNYPVVLLQQSQGSYVTLTAPVVIPLNAWTHFTVTLSGTAASPNNTLTLYINGTAQGTVQSYTHATAAPAYLANLLLFNGFTGATNAFHGELDTVQVYQRPLTTAEIAATATASSEKTPAIQAHSVRITGTLQLSDTTTLDVTPTNSSNAASTLQVTTSDYQMRDLSGNIASVPDVTNGKVIPVPFGPFANSPNEGSIFLDNPVTNPGSNGAYLTMQNSNAYGFNWWQNGGFTFETWVNSKSIQAGNAYIIGQMDPIISSSRWWSIHLANGILEFMYWNGSVGVLETGLSTFSTNTWYHIAVTCDAGNPTNTIRLFVNGSLEKTSTVNGTPQISSTVPITMGQYTSVGANNAYISNSRWVRGAALYTTTFTPPTAPLGPATSGTTVLLLRTAKFQRTPLQLTSDGQLSVSKITAADTSISSQAYPPAALTGHVTNITTSTYGKGYYIVSASSEFSTSYQGWRLFDRTGTQWASGYTYSASSPYSHNGTITTSDTNGINYSGEWIQIQLPLSISLTAYTLTGTSGQSIKFPARFYILGSINGVNWTLVSQQSAIPYSASPQLFTVNTTRAFTYYRIVINQLTGNGIVADFSEWLLYGKPESLNITADGRLGVGVVNPTQALEVAGNAVFGGNISAGNLGMFRNRIINGDMRIDQRNNGGILSNTGYSVDRWLSTNINTQGGQCTTQRVQDSPANFSSSLKFTNTNAGTGINQQHLRYIMEGYTIADFNWGTSYAAPITISFWVKSSISGNFGITLNGSLVDTLHQRYGLLYTINNSNVWEYKTITIPGSTTGIWNIDNTVGLIIIFGFGYATSRKIPYNNEWISAAEFYIMAANASNSIATTLNATFQLTGLQLEKGILATPFEFRPYQIELQLCQRYYYLFKSRTSVGTEVNLGLGVAHNANTATFILSLCIPLRTHAPILECSRGTASYSSAVTFLGNASDDVYTYNYGTATARFFTSIRLIEEVEPNNADRFGFYLTGSSGLTAGDAIIFITTGTLGTFLALNAEL
jgi:hypothetical protein